MRTEVRLPDLGARSAVLSVWFSGEGERVFEGERLVEVLVGGATFDVAAPATGRLIARHALVGDDLQTGQPLGTIEQEASREWDRRDEWDR